MTPVAIVGAGISGLTAAFYLQQRGIPVVLYEASDRAGGMIHTACHGGYISEYGPNTIMTNSVAVPRLIRDLDLESRRLLPSASAGTRYIVRDGRLVRLPQSLPGAIGTGLLSLSAKLRVLVEPFIPRRAFAANFGPVATPKSSRGADHRFFVVCPVAQQPRRVSSTNFTPGRE